MSNTPEIAAIRAIWTPDDAPHGAHILDTAPWNTTVEMAQSHIATLLAALDEAQAREAPVLAAAEALVAGNRSDICIGWGETHWAAWGHHGEYLALVAALSELDAHRAATTPTP